MDLRSVKVVGRHVPRISEGGACDRPLGQDRVFTPRLGETGVGARTTAARCSSREKYVEVLGT